MEKCEAYIHIDTRDTKVWRRCTITQNGRS